MITLQRVNLDRLEPRTFELLLPRIYYLIHTIFPVNSLPEGNQRVLSSVPFNETLGQTFDRERIGENELARITNLTTNRGEMEEIRYYAHGEKWMQRVIIPEDIQWRNLSCFAMNCTGCSQTNFYPMGIARREQIDEFLKRYAH